MVIKKGQIWQHSSSKVVTVEIISVNDHSAVIYTKSRLEARIFSTSLEELEERLRSFYISQIDIHLGALYGR